MLSNASKYFASLIYLADGDKHHRWRNPSTLQPASGGTMSDENPERLRAKRLGEHLRQLREGLGFTLRDVERATDKVVSNAYLSQMENGHILRPSPNALHALSTVYEVAYSDLMERAGYISPTPRQSDQEKHGQAATFAIDNLTREEETELRSYLSFVRQRLKNS
jgi:HTH-type transcriptional regulator, competence development regulator